ncbi:MAG TPA: glycosyltransferase family 39 protein, partial [Anaerolineales bacterium]|nr:glycosyltransferase family 39 protein [Anaerolineales bacterium]
MKTLPLSKYPAWLPFLILLILLGLTLRLIDLNDPPLDFHATRQLRNYLVARNIYYQLLPDADSKLRELASSFERTVGHYEPPVIESLVAVTYLAVGRENFAIPRIWESLFWVLAGIALFDLARRTISPWAGLTALAYYLVLPFAVQASRSFQPDPLMTSAFVAGIYSLYRWSEERNWKWAIWAGIFLGFATLVKIVIAFFTGAAAVVLVLFTLRKDFWKSRQVWVMVLLLIVPSLTYYVFLNSGRSSEYFVNWSVALFKLISSSDFYSKWLAFLGSLFGLTVLFMSLAGALISSPRLCWLLMGLWIGYLAYGLTLPLQMYTHSYYHIQLVPVVALGLASVLDSLYKTAATQSVARRVVFLALVVAVIGFHSWVARSVLVAQDYRHEPEVWKKIGDAIPEDAKVISLTQDYGYRLMLFAWRRVNLWPLDTHLTEIRNQGRDPASRFEEIVAGDDYFLVTAFRQLDKQPDLKKILDQYPIAAEGDGFV